MNVPKWTEYPKGQVLEKDLPPGVWYRWVTDGPDVRMVALANGERMFTGRSGRDYYDPDVGPRRDSPVTILDWPDHCGPRPDTRHPTYEQVVKNAPSRDAYVVFCHSGGGKEFIKASAFSFGETSRATGKVLGYLEFPES